MQEISVNQLTLPSKEQYFVSELNLYYVVDILDDGDFWLVENCMNNKLVCWPVEQLMSPEIKLVKDLKLGKEGCVNA